MSYPCARCGSSTAGERQTFCSDCACELLIQTGQDRETLLQDAKALRERDVKENFSQTKLNS